MSLIDNLILGIYIGVLTGVFAAIIIYVLTVLFTYLTGQKLSINYALMIGLGVAGLAGGPRLILRDPELLQSFTVIVMLLVVLLISLYAHTKGQDLGKALPPKTVVMNTFRRRTISSGVIKHIGRFGQVEIRPTGEVMDIEGYPPLSERTRQAIRTDRWTFPADLPIQELEHRLEETLQRDHDLADAIVRIDANGEATIRGAPPTGGLSQRVPDEKQVVAVDATLPAGIAAGDTVRMILDDTTVTGQVISARTDNDSTGSTSDTETREEATPPEEGESEEQVTGEPPRIGGTGRVALAIDPDDVATVVERDVDKLYVQSRGQNREYELVSLLRRNDDRLHKLTLRAESEYLDRTLGELDLRRAHGVAVLALNRANEWRFAPGYRTKLRPGDELFVAGPKGGIDALRELVT